MRFAALLVLSAALPLGLGAAGIPISTFNTIPPSGNITNIPMPSQAVAPSAFQLGQILNRPKLRELRHHWAVGIDSIPALSLAGSAGTAVAVPNALSVRWWAGDRLGLDLLAGGNFSSAQSGSGEVLSPLVSSNPGTAVYAGALAVRFNVSELSRDLLSQILVKVSGAQSAQEISAGTEKVDTTTLAVFVGAGFEAFIPGWDWLSLEGSVGITGFSQSLTPQSGPLGPQTVSGLGLAGNGFSPINLSAHVYF